MYWTDGSVYKGQWHNGVQHGQGKMMFPDGTSLQGLFKNNVLLDNNSQANHSRLVIREEQEIEAEIYNVPNFKNTYDGHKSAIGTFDSPLIQKIPNTVKFNSPSNLQYRMLRRSIDNFTPQTAIKISDHFTNLNSSIPRKVRNTYNGFPLIENPKLSRHKTRVSKRTYFKPKRGK